MSRPSFNVLQERWIPVIYPDGSKKELGILDCLFQANKIKEIRDPSPIIEFGLYRLLIAFVLDALTLSNQRPEDPLDLEQLIGKGHLDKSMIEDYVEECGDVFDLFHPQHPFYQVPLGDASPKPVAGLYPVAPSGTGVMHWLHTFEDNIAVTPTMATRLLATIPPFMTAGGAGLSPSINGSPAIYILPCRASLFETIIINLPLRKQDSGKGVSAWRSDRKPGQERSQATTIESLTWQPRCIQFLPEASSNGDILIRQMKYEKGDKTRLNWIDGNLAYRYEKDKFSPVRMREGRPLLRDSGPLLFVKEVATGVGDRKHYYQRPDVVDQAFQVSQGNQALEIKAYAMRTDMKMKVFEWTKTIWTVPVQLGISTRLGSLLMSELGKAEQIANMMYYAIKSLYPRAGAGNKKALQGIAHRTLRKYWNILESSFDSLMYAFSKMSPADANDPDKIMEVSKDWRQSIADTAKEQFEFAAKDMDADADALKRQVEARSKLHNKLRKELS